MQSHSWTKDMANKWITDSQLRDMYLSPYNLSHVYIASFRYMKMKIYIFQCFIPSRFFSTSQSVDNSNQTYIQKNPLQNLLKYAQSCTYMSTVVLFICWIALFNCWCHFVVESSWELVTIRRGVTLGPNLRANNLKILAFKKLIRNMFLLVQWTGCFNSQTWGGIFRRNPQQRA